MNRLKAQITIEYLLLIAVIILVLLWALSGNGPIVTGLDNFFTNLGDKLGEIVPNT